MKFRTKTDMYTASFNDVLLAAQQGAIKQVQLGNTKYLSNTRWTFGRAASLAFFGFSLFVFLLGLALLGRAIRRATKPSSFSEPLVASEKGVVA